MRAVAEGARHDVAHTAKHQPEARLYYDIRRITVREAMIHEQTIAGIILDFLGLGGVVSSFHWFVTHFIKFG